MRGLTFNVQRDSTEDGPGIRTTVFMKGCPMRCPWCHNPEGMRSGPELVWYEARCIGCGECVKTCPRDALSRPEMDPDERRVNIDRSSCDACGECVEACAAEALEVLGAEMSVEELGARVLRDRIFYEKSNGGMTMSGGEPAMQAAFCAELIRAVRGEGIHVALDTCGGTSWRVLDPLVRLSDLVLFDMKLMDAEGHLEYTGIPIDVVLANAREIAGMKKPVWVRTPVIPGYTDEEENIRGVARFIASSLPTVERYDLLAFNNACAAKYRRLDRPWDLADRSLMREERMEELASAAAAEGLECVHWSGMTAARDGSHWAPAFRSTEPPARSR